MYSTKPASDTTLAVDLRSSHAEYSRVKASADTEFVAIAPPLREAGPILRHGSIGTATTLIDRLDNTMLVTGLLLSPIYSTTSMHGVVDKPALRAIAYLACILDTSGLLTSAAYRLRLRFLKARNLDEQFAQQLCSSWSGRFLATTSPIVLIASAILLFLTSLSGSLFSTVDAGKAFEAALGTPELALLTVGLSFAIIHGRFVFGSLTV